jgi:NhaA family Na+:H+ antiporter
MNMLRTKIFKDFFESEKIGGFILISCTIISLLVANSSIGFSYHHFWTSPVFGQTLEYWINDGLMTIFFLLIGLELEREIYQGELSNKKDALLPIFAALGGMLVPAGIYLFFNWETATQSGAGIPIATDIAFALGVLSLLGNRVPVSLKIFLTALAVIDDLGAILVIAFFYTKTILWTNLLIALALFIGLFILGKYFKVRNLIPYIIGGVAMWYFMLHSGIHATITGVLLAFAIPFGKGEKKSISYILQHALHKPVAFVILPIFALANTAIAVNGNIEEILVATSSIGIALGLIIGKPLGIFLLTLVAVKLRFCRLPEGLNWKTIVGVGFLGGVGFTMSIFITLLAFENEMLISNAKLIIMLASLLAGSLGYVFLKIVLKNKPVDNNE